MQAGVSLIFKRSFSGRQLSAAGVLSKMLLPLSFLTITTLLMLAFYSIHRYFDIPTDVEKSRLLEETGKLVDSVQYQETLLSLETILHNNIDNDGME